MKDGPPFISPWYFAVGNSASVEADTAGNTANARLLFIATAK